MLSQEEYTSTIIRSKLNEILFIDVYDNPQYFAVLLLLGFQVTPAVWHANAFHFIATRVTRVAHYFLQRKYNSGSFQVSKQWSLIQVTVNIRIKYK